MGLEDAELFAKKCCSLTALAGVGWIRRDSLVSDKFT